MKKTIISTILFLMILFPTLQVFAYVNPGAGSDYTCITSNYENRNCKTTNDILKRIAELEKRVNDLESNCQNIQQPSNVNNIANLEIRLQTIENTIKTLQENIFGSLKSIIILLINK